MLNNFKSLALCAAILSFGFANEDNIVYPDLNVVTQSIESQNIDNIYAVLYKNKKNYRNILCINDQSEENVELSDFVVTYQDQFGCLNFKCEYESLKLEGDIKYNLTRSSATMIYSISQNKTKKSISIGYMPYSNNSGTLLICDFQQSDKISNIQLFNQFLLEDFSLSVEKIIHINQKIFEHLPESYKQNITFTDNTKKSGISIIKRYKKNISRKIKLNNFIHTIKGFFCFLTHNK